MILLKDNHVDFAGGIDKAILRAQNYLKEKGKDLKIEIEVRSFDELAQVLRPLVVSIALCSTTSVWKIREKQLRL